MAKKTYNTQRQIAYKPHPFLLLYRAMWEMAVDDNQTTVRTAIDFQLCQQVEQCLCGSPEGSKSIEAVRLRHGIHSNASCPPFERHVEAVSSDGACLLRHCI